MCDFPPEFRTLALELPRESPHAFPCPGYRSQRPKRLGSRRDPKVLIAQAAIYQRKATHMKAHSERRRIAAWEAKQEALAEAASTEADESVPPEPEALMRDPIQYAVDRISKLVNTKLVI